MPKMNSGHSSYELHFLAKRAIHQESFTKGELMKAMSRRDLLKTAITGAGTLVLISLMPKAQAQSAQLQSSISRNHGHQFTETLETLMANGPKTYNIKGGSSHGHALTITQEILDTLNKTKVVDVDSAIGAGHDHIVRLQIVG